MGLFSPIQGLLYVVWMDYLLVRVDSRARSERSAIGDEMRFRAIFSAVMREARSCLTNMSISRVCRVSMDAKVAGLLALGEDSEEEDADLSEVVSAA